MKWSCFTVLQHGYFSNTNINNYTNTMTTNTWVCLCPYLDPTCMPLSQSGPNLHASVPIWTHLAFLVHQTGIRHHILELWLSYFDVNERKHNNHMLLFHYEQLKVAKQWLNKISYILKRLISSSFWFLKESEKIIQSKLDEKYFGVCSLYLQ